MTSIVVVDFSEATYPLLEILKFYPTIDIDAIFDQLIDHLEQGVPIGWQEHVRDLMYKGQLIETFYLHQSVAYYAPILSRQYEYIPVPTNDCDRLIGAIAYLGQQIETQMTTLNMYRDRQLYYAYQGRIRHDIFEFVCKPAAEISSTRH